MYPPLESEVQAPGISLLSRKVGSCNAYSRRSRRIEHYYFLDPMTSFVIARFHVPPEAQIFRPRLVQIQIAVTGKRRAEGKRNASTVGMNLKDGSP